MITLQIEKYCHNCPDFEPVTNVNSCSYFSPERLAEVILNETTVTCKYRHRCANQMDYLKKEEPK